MNQIFFAAGVLLFPAVCTTLGAAGVFLLRRSAAPRTQRGTFVIHTAFITGTF